MGARQQQDWTLIPASARDIEQLRERCRRLVRRRAALSASVSALPVPGLDIVSDIRLFGLLIEDINREFGLTEAQIERLRPEFKLVAYQAAAGIGGMLIGKVVTRELVAHLLKRSGVKAAARQAGKLVPVAGQLMSAALGFLLFRQIGYQHVEACAAVAQELLVAGAH
ncbi:hypothetical protein [Rugamonas sp.]|uniref:hypothetical protein n=1 Tax=Rugamonas sp. TaxID=1926287 RepID=UPI0025E538B0|nr:hypothetical protein [Rugamonas sp.]